MKPALSGATSNVSSRYWIGVNNLEGNGWQNIDDNSTPTFFDWANGEPGTSIINSCVVVDTKGYWYHEDCFASHSFVCEVSEVGVTTKQPPTSLTRISTQGNTVKSTPQSSVATTSSSSTLCRSYIPFSMGGGDDTKAEKDFLINYFIDAVFPIDIGIAPFVYYDDYWQESQVPVDITQLKTEIQSVSPSDVWSLSS